MRGTYICTPTLILPRQGGGGLLVIFMVQGCPPGMWYYGLISKQEFGTEQMSLDTSKDARGIVFHIIHGSFVDGHGVRTTVFLKGCPLRCVWCCNPEGQAACLEIKITSGKCNRCEKCMRICPNRAILLNGEGENVRVSIDRDLCTNCKECIDVCFTGALEVFGKDMSVGEVFHIVQQDRLYYQHSGGGVTIGGGEPTSQPSFTYGLLKKCQEKWYPHSS